MSITIHDVTFRGEDDHDYIWDVNEHLAPTPGGGTDEGKILVCLDIDGAFDGIYANLGQTGDLVGIGRAIAALQAIHDGLTRLYGGDNRPGRCMIQADWGRCYSDHGHDGCHDFPSREHALTRMGIKPQMAEADQ